MENPFSVTRSEERIITYFSNGFRVLRSDDGIIIFRKAGVNIVDVVGEGGRKFYLAGNLIVYNDGYETKLFDCTTHEISNIQRKYEDIYRHYYVGDDLWLQTSDKLARVKDGFSIIAHKCELVIRATDDYVVVITPIHWDPAGCTYVYDKIGSEGFDAYKFFIRWAIYKTSDLQILHKGEFQTINPVTKNMTIEESYRGYLNMIGDTITITKERIEIYDTEFKLSERLTGECVVCFESVNMMQMLPCKHTEICKSCVGQLTKCPLCRARILEVVFAFK
jgi:hypothetical protein